MIRPTAKPTNGIRKRTSKNPPPELKVGDLGTMHSGTDRYGVMVIKVEDQGKTIHVVFCSDQGEIRRGIAANVLNWRRNGVWAEKGSKQRRGGSFYAFDGIARNYKDPYF